MDNSMDMDMDRTPSPGPPSRSMEIHLGQEIITIDLGSSLDPNPDTVLEVLLEGQCKVWYWTKLAGEYWRRGLFDSAEKLAKEGVEFFKSDGASSLPPLYTLLANIRMARARQAPKKWLEGARRDITNEPVKDSYYQEAARYLNDAANAGNVGDDDSTILAFLSRGILQLAQRNMENALQSFENVLSRSPTNLIALLGKARVLYAQRKYQHALKLFQDVLRLNPQCNPDPRIGIGLCLWALGNKEKARVAWKRSLDVNPDSWSAQLLLGIDVLNQSRDPSPQKSLSESTRAQLTQEGYKLIERVFNLNKFSASAANILSSLFLRKGNYSTALKLAERAIQYADTLVIVSDGYIRAGLVAHAEGRMVEAMKHFGWAKEGMGNSILANVGLAQIYIHNDEIPAAIDTLDRLLTPPNPQKSLEAMIMLASLRAYPRPGVSNADADNERLRARELYERVVKEIQLADPSSSGTGQAQAPTRTVRNLGNDAEMWIELAQLWEHDNVEKTSRAIREALRISKEKTTSEAGPDVEDPRLVNNLAALRHSETRLDEARELYEEALTLAGKIQGNGAQLSSDANDMQHSTLGVEEWSATMLYNLARCYEDLGEVPRAQEAYQKLLARHPEYIDAKVRLASVLHNLNQASSAHELLKQALLSHPTDMNLRAFYTHYLLSIRDFRSAKDFIFATLKDHDKYDVYTLCAAGIIMYTQARETRDYSTEGLKARRNGFIRAAEFYERALGLDSNCAVAAMGLAIVLAEDALGAFGIAPPGIPGISDTVEDPAVKVRNAREALDVLTKVRECVPDGSVYANMGHCYFAREEYERAIESYETASRRFYNDQNVPVLLSLMRTWYVKASKDQRFDEMQTALKYAEKALHLQPYDKTIIYNIAMIQQKAAEISFDTHPSKRTLSDLRRAIEQAAHAQKLFGALAAGKGEVVPYSRELADHRRKYGDSMLRKGADHLSTQDQYESEIKERLDAARQRRQEEKERLEALERQRLEQLRMEAEELRKKRQLEIEEAKAWTEAAKLYDSDEDEKKQKGTRSRRKKGEKADIPSDDEVDGEKKKRRKAKPKRAASPSAGETPGEDAGEEEPLFSDLEGGEDKPKKRSGQKRVIREDDEEDTAPKKKKYKSKEVIENSDEDM